tara:strand:+ start:320 stop:529 length:210 start_codon:yes stop_codon:yes gene_type:complete
MENIIEESIRNSYYVMTGKATVEDLIIRKDFPILFVDENWCEEDINDMLDYFISTEEYEKCQELVELMK